MNYFISAEELYQKLEEKLVNLKIIDVRGDLLDLELGAREYGKAHLPNAIFLDGEKELTGVITEHGGRHPLPNMEDFKASIKAIGISPDDEVVIYGFFAPRLLMMLNMIGIYNTKILDGGFEYYQKKFKTDDQVPTLKEYQGEYKQDPDKNFVVDFNFVRENYQNSNYLLIDCRSPERYSGENEPIDKIAGRIEGAINVFWKSLYNEDGKLRNLDEIKKEYQAVIESDKELILYCGSGITLGFTLMVLKEIGLNPLVYMGSYSDWISYEECAEEVKKRFHS